MSEFSALDRLVPGQSAYVTQVLSAGPMGRRLADLGLIPGTRVTCLFQSPAGDPAAYLIRGAVIALRGSDAARIRVEPLPLPVRAAREGSLWA